MSDFEPGISLNYYLTLVSFTILLHEYLDTLAMEVDRMWYSTFHSPRMSWNWASFLFYLNRYLVLFGHAPVMLKFFWRTSDPNKLQICHALREYHQYLVIVIQAIISCMLIMRVYVLYERSRRVLAVLVGMVLAPISFGCWSVLVARDQTPDMDPVLPVGCAASLTRNQGIHIGAAWAGMLVFDSVIFVMTVLKSFPLRSKSQDLITVLLRDGTIYFSVILAVNLANILILVLGGPFTRSLGTVPMNVISSVMISRLALNLRDPALVRRRQSGEPGMSSTAGVCPNISTVAQTQYTRDPEDEWGPTDTTYELYEENNGYRGPGRPHGIQTHAIQLTPVNHRL